MSLKEAPAHLQHQGCYRLHTGQADIQHWRPLQVRG